MKRVPLKLWILLLLQILLILIAILCPYPYATLICEVISIIMLLYVSSIDSQIIYKRKYGKLESFIYLFCLLTLFSSIRIPVDLVMLVRIIFFIIRSAETS